MKKLLVGLLVDSTWVSTYVYDLAAWASAQDNIEISHLVVHPVPDAAPSMPFRIIASLERGYLVRRGHPRKHFDLEDIGPLVKETLFIQPMPAGSDCAWRFPSEDVGRVRRLELDLLLECGTLSLTGEILSAARLGAIALRYGGPRVPVGSPPGFWECYHRWPKTRFEVQRLNQGSADPDILLRGSFATKPLHTLNQSHIYAKSYAHLRDLLKHISRTGHLPPSESHRTHARSLMRRPGFLYSMAYAAKTVHRLGKSKCLSLLRCKETWSISIARGDWKTADLPRSTRINAPRGRFWADPFLWVNGGTTYCFVEDYVYRAGRAHISVLEVRGTTAVELGPCVTEPFHVSFPFLFQYDGELYMCPEAAQSGQIRVYRCRRFPLEWELCAVLMDGVSAADTVVFEKGGKWWMLTSLDTAGTNDRCSELYLFSSSSPLCSDWQPHPRNPVRIDADGGRNAGLIREGDRILRLGQRQGFARYGAGLQVHEITVLSEAAYSEKLVGRLDPHFRLGLLGTHHLSSTGSTTVVDHRSRSFVL